MRSIIILAITFLLIIIKLAESADLKCSYGDGEWSVLGYVYICDTQNTLDIISKDAAMIESVNQDFYTDVEVFRADSKVIHYFPRGLKRNFPKLTGIYMIYCGLKEIKQNDLKPFRRNLKYLNLMGNQIETLEGELFIFNINLELIKLSGNKISQIDPRVFDNLLKLKTLFLKYNLCFNSNVENNKAAVSFMINDVKAKCANPN